eukprot:834584-Prymnesium_polylepis.1
MEEAFSRYMSWEKDEKAKTDVRRVYDAGLKEMRRRRNLENRRRAWRLGVPGVQAEGAALGRAGRT